MGKKTAVIIMPENILHLLQDCDECNNGFVATVSREVYETALRFEAQEETLGHPGWYLAEGCLQEYDNEQHSEDFKFWSEVCDLLKVRDFGCGGAILVLPEDAKGQTIMGDGVGTHTALFT